MSGSGEAIFLTARWESLVMLNYEVQPAILRGLVPVGCELDDWSGRTFVSMVGFRFLDTKVLGVALPFHRHFDEVNLRFYVRRRAGDQWRRGVVFVKEIVPRRAIALVARVAYGENYVAMPMRHQVPATLEAGAHVAYEWRRHRRWESLSATLEGAPAVRADDSEEAFITEHYWGYSRQRDGSTVEYQVEHPRWRVWRATDARLEGDVSALYGHVFVAALSAAPASAFVADGSDVRVRRGRRLPV